MTTRLGDLGSLGIWGTSGSLKTPGSPGARGHGERRMQLKEGLTRWSQGHGLANNGDDDMMTFADALALVRLAVVLLMGWGLVTWGFSWLHLSWVLYGALTGLASGLLAGCVVIITIPQKLQLAAVGAITGMGVD